MPVAQGPAAQTLASDFIEKFSLDIHGYIVGTMLFRSTLQSVRPVP